MANKGLAARGSQKWLQLLVKEYKPIFFREIVREMPQLNLNNNQIEWLSPLEKDNYCEYSDGAFIEQLRVKLNYTPLVDFWPNRGPVWDGLARTEKGDLLLFEAKSHIGELLSFLRAQDPNSLRQINQSLNQVKEFLEADSHLDWVAPFYQYTNRLAHLYLLRVVNQLPAYLIFIYFVNDPDMKGPSTKAEWQGAIKLMKTLLGLSRHKLSKYLVEMFIDVNEMQAETEGKS
jgi:hypothetical protein